MRINIVTGPFYPVPPAPCGAVERIWHDLAEEFAKRGHEITVLCRHWPGQKKDETIKGVRYVRRMRLSHTRSIYWDLLQDLWYSLRMWLLLPQADITVTNVFWLPIALGYRRHVGKVVVNVARWPKGQMGLYKRVSRLAACSSPVAAEIIRQCPELAPLVKVLPNPINAAAFVPPLKPRSLCAGAGTILYTGRVHPEKGVHLLVDAFRRLLTEFPGLRLRIIGATSIPDGGGGADYLATMTNQALGIPVEFIPPIYDRVALARELQSADYYCYPSLAEQGESFGVAPLEAMATGLAPIVSGLAVFRDFITPGRTGLIFDHSSADPAEKLASELRKFIQDRKAAAEMGKAASTVAVTYSNEAVASLFLADFDNLLRSN